MDRLGDYRLRKRLAVGGMGEVYLGEKVGPEGFVKPVVLKCVLPQLATDRAFVQLFLDEARLAALLNHPNIAQIYDFGHVDNVYYMAMEYVPGYTVDDLRRKHASIDKWMPIEHIACVATQVCQGLNYAHSLADARGVSLGLVHRDVSPHNIIVSVDGAAKIVDFGIAKARSGLTRVQAKGAVGKFGYMSPEQSRGEQVDPRTDVFSLGVCLWELVTNRRLHDAKIDRPPDYDPKSPITNVTAFRRDVPRQFERILETALAIDPNDRYANCQEMHLDIERFLAAMTHYAGQAALSHYLKDLAEGRVEAPPEVRTQMVEPAGGRKAGGKQTDNLLMLEGAQRYEEVFGVETGRPSPAAAPRAVPASWTQSKVPAPVERAPAPAAPPERARPPSGVMGNQHEEPGLELKTGRTPAPQLAGAPATKPEPVDRTRADRLARAEHAASRRAGSRTGVILALLVLLLGGLGALAFVNQDRLAEWARSRNPPPPPPPPSNTVYRITSQPDGAQVFVDGTEASGPTPVDLQLSPGLEYRVDVKKAGFGTKSAIVKATAATTTRELGFKLDPAASLKISSNPPGAKIEINGFEIVGVVTPATLTDVPGTTGVRVTVALAGGTPKTRVVDLKPGKTEKAVFELDAPP